MGERAWSMDEVREKASKGLLTSIEVMLLDRVDELFAELTAVTRERNKLRVKVEALCSQRLSDGGCPAHAIRIAELEAELAAERLEVSRRVTPDLCESRCNAARAEGFARGVEACVGNLEDFAMASKLIAAERVIPAIAADKLRKLQPPAAEAPSRRQPIGPEVERVRRDLLADDARCPDCTWADGKRVGRCVKHRSPT